MGSVSEGSDVAFDGLTAAAVAGGRGHGDGCRQGRVHELLFASFNGTNVNRSAIAFLIMAKDNNVVSDLKYVSAHTHTHAHIRIINVKEKQEVCIVLAYKQLKQPTREAIELSIKALPLPPQVE